MPLPERKMPITYYIGMFILVGIILSSAITQSISSLDGHETKSPFKLIVEIEVQKPDGTIINECVDDDIILTNFVHAMLNCLEGTSGLGANYDAVDTTGTTRNIGDSWNVDESDIVIGDGITAVTLADYVLDNQIATARITGNGYQESGLGFNVTLTASWNPTMAYTIREVGLTTMLDAGTNDFLMCRDVLSTSVGVDNGDVVTLKYIFVMNQ